MIEPDHPQLSIGQQCRLLSIARSSYYYEPKGETAQNLGLMRQIDEQFLETPFFGVRQMTWHLRNDGHLVNEKRIRRLMRLMGLMPIYQKPNAVPELEWKAPAVADLLAIVDYISDDNPDAALALMEEIQDKVAQLPAHPKRCRPGRVEGTRELVVRPNYIVVYAETPSARSSRTITRRSIAWS
ncbi:type II toxin-antitoxin system mRNA interferase toxin, RelE/StbE family [Rhodovulum sp. YEN HP10]|uniref:type II toxin-antitoxin system mRNA interferase toxin, RelE/StbE family n=1 Tax=Rhodovulum sp. HP10 TaxID=3387397 RepID=UPI0039E05805